MNRTSGPTPETCRNCGKRDTGRYCPNCGQRTGETRVSMRRLLADLLEDQLSIDSTLPRTLGALFLHPGRLTREHAAAARDSIRAIADSTGMRRDADAAPRVRGIFIDPSAFDDPDSTHWDEAVIANTGIPALDHAIETRVRRFGSMGGAAAGASILRDMLQRAPTVMFVLLPVFALILKLLYIRSGRFYVEHFVFALRYHAFAFVLFTIMLPLENTWIPALLTIWLIVYLPLAMKHVYRQGWFATGVKFVLLSTADLIVLVIGLTVTLILALLLA